MAPAEWPILVAARIKTTTRVEWAGGPPRCEVRIETFAAPDIIATIAVGSQLVLPSGHRLTVRDVVVDRVGGARLGLLLSASAESAAAAKAAVQWALDPDQGGLVVALEGVASSRSGRN